MAPFFWHRQRSPSVAILAGSRIRDVRWSPDQAFLGPRQGSPRRAAPIPAPYQLDIIILIGDSQLQKSRVARRSTHTSLRVIARLLQDCCGLLSFDGSKPGPQHGCDCLSGMESVDNVLPLRSLSVLRAVVGSIDFSQADGPPKSFQNFGIGLCDSSTYRPVNPSGFRR